MSNPDLKMQCSDHGESHATFVCQHLCRSSGLGFFFADDHEVEDLRPDAWCEDCDRLLVEGGGEWTEEAQAVAGVSCICARCYDRVRQNNEVPFKRIRPQCRPNLEQDGWELASVCLKHALNPESFVVPFQNELARIREGDLVKLLFLFPVEEAGSVVVACERMWVIVEKVESSRYTGILESRPALSERVREFDTLSFQADHIAAVHRQGFIGRVGALLWSRLAKFMGVKGASRFRHVRPSDNSKRGAPNPRPEADA